MFLERKASPVPDEVTQTFINSHKLKEPSSGIKSKVTRWTIGLGIPATALAISGIGAKWATNNADIAAELSRDTIGVGNTQQIEKKYLELKDRKTRALYEIGLGPDKKPFDTPQIFIANPIIEEPALPYAPSLTPSYIPPQYFEEPIIEIAPPPEPAKPKPFVLPETHILLPNPIAGEGQWSVDGLPTTAEDPFMAKTTIRPDAARPYANVSALVFDSRRIKLNMAGGAIKRGVGGDQGPGKVPDADLGNLLVVINGGFQLDHARENYSTSGRFIWGAYLDGVEYATLQPDMASVAVFADGSIKLGAWGEGDLTTRTEDMIAVRQNGGLMIKDGELTPAVENETDLFTWGKITATSTDFITTRSAIGMTADGNLMIAVGNNMSALSLARGMQAVGAITAMQLDINSPWVQAGIVSEHTADGTPILSSFTSSVGNGNKFLKPQDRDLIYITRDDDSRFK